VNELALLEASLVLGELLLIAGQLNMEIEHGKQRLFLVVRKNFVLFWYAFH
jgi:hypothetical protein